MKTESPLVFSRFYLNKKQKTKKNNKKISNRRFDFWIFPARAFIEIPRLNNNPHNNFIQKEEEIASGFPFLLCLFFSFFFHAWPGSLYCCSSFSRHRHEPRTHNRVDKCCAVSKRRRRRINGIESKGAGTAAASSRREKTKTTTMTPLLCMWY